MSSKTLSRRHLLGGTVSGGSRFRGCADFDGLRLVRGAGLPPTPAPTAASAPTAAAAAPTAAAAAPTAAAAAPTAAAAAPTAATGSAPTATGAAASQPTAATKPASGAPVKLTNVEDDSRPLDNQAYANVYKAFQQQNPNIQIDFQILPWEQAEAKERTMAQAKTTGHGRSAFAPSLVKLNGMVPLDSMVKPDFLARYPQGWVPTLYLQGPEESEAFVLHCLVCL